jgi:hypothetical protein
MIANRVTLSALGTTGVLLAASLTMLALVSALVTFDAWPRRDVGPSPSEVAVQRAGSPKLVRAIRRGPAARAAARARAARAVAAAGRLESGGAAAAGAGPAPRFAAAPTPRVPGNPPGTGPGGPLVSVGGPGRGPDHPIDGPPSPVHAVACGAGAAVSGVYPAAGSAVGTACKAAPPLQRSTRDGSLADGGQG